MARLVETLALRRMMIADLSGTQIDKYHLTKRLGEGTFGDVYQGKNVYDEEIVAVKVLKFALTKETLKEFLNEARSMFHLRHAHIVPLLDFGIDNMSMAPFLVMAYAPHGTLRQRHPVGTRVPLETVLSYVKPLAAALQYAHEKRLIHRDVKPPNMLLGDQGMVLLSDFGVAVTAHSEHSLSTQNMSGTLPYMAPEQIQGHPRPASDQYSLAVVVYEWLCGVRPFQGSDVQIIDQHRSRVPPSLRTNNPALSVGVENVVLQALAKQPQERYPTILAFAQALEHAYKQARVTPPQDILADEKKALLSFPSPASSRNAREVLSKSAVKPDDIAIDSPIIELPSRRGRAVPPRKPDPTSKTPHQTRSSRHLPSATARGTVVESAANVSTPTPHLTPSPTVPLTSTRMNRAAVRPHRFGRCGPIPRRGLLLAGSILFLPLLLCSSFVFVQPMNPLTQSIRAALSIASSRTVTITPESKLFGDTFTFMGANTTDTAARTVAVRTVSGTAQSTPVQVNATGHNQHAATMAQGTITFFNDITAPQQINAGTRLPVGGGITLITDENAMIPAANLPTEGQTTIAAHAGPAGRAGNVGAFVLDAQACCRPGITVSNTVAFTGGQDAVNNRFLQQADATNAITPHIQETTMQGAMSNLSQQVHMGEQLVGAMQCHPIISADQQFGDQGVNVTHANITYRIKCTSIAYDNAGAQKSVHTLLAQKAATILPRGYTLVGNIQVGLTNQTTVNNTTSFFLSGKGIWVYQVNNQQKMNIIRSIVGKSVAGALALLKETPGVDHATVTPSSGNLPSNPSQISIQVQPLLTGPTLSAPQASPPLSQPTIAAPLVQGGGTGTK